MDFPNLDFDPELEELGERVRAKVASSCNETDYGLLGAWDAHILFAKLSENSEALLAFERLIVPKKGSYRTITESYSGTISENDPRIIKMLCDTAAESDKYTLADVQPEHFEAFWTLQEAVCEVDDSRKCELYPLIFEDPSSAPMLAALTRAHGWVSMDTMRALLLAMKGGSITLADGVL